MTLPPRGTAIHNPAGCSGSEPRCVPSGYSTPSPPYNSHQYQNKPVSSLNRRINVRTKDL